MDLDELFGDGAELGDDVVVKAQLRFRIHPPKHPVAQDIVDRLVTGYDECLDAICGEVGDVLRHADVRKAIRSQPLVLDLSKAGQQVYSPGAKGGKWYRDGQGHIRYGEQPMPQYKQRASEQHTGREIGHYRPSQFLGMGGIDRDLTAFLLHNGGKYGFRKPELRFLGSWYGTSTKSGALFDAFLDCAQLTREDLKGDITQLRFGGQKITYEEAVFEFFAAQRSLFMGDESGVEDADAEWDRMLNDEIRPLLDSVFSKYESLKEDPAFKEAFAAEPDKIRRRFFERARQSEESTRDIADRITSGWNPEKVTAEVIEGMRALGLLSRPSKVGALAYAHDRPHLQDSVVVDDRLLVDDPKSNPLLVDSSKLGSLSVSQLMLLFAAAELHRRWDPDTRSYSTEQQADIGPGYLGEAAFMAIVGKWGGSAPLVRKHLDKIVDHLVAALNLANTGLGQPEQKKRPKKAKK